MPDDDLKPRIERGELDAREIVRAGYDEIADAYLAARDRSGSSGDMLLLRQLLADLPPGSAVLDVGCGAGDPASIAIADAGMNVVGVDISEAQIERARHAVPTGEFRVADISEMELPEASFDLVIAFYSLFHIPREAHAAVYASVRRALRPQGRFVATLGRRDHAVDLSDEWIGGAPMFWSHFDTPTSLAMLQEAGFVIDEVRWVAETLRDTGFEHPFVVARVT